VKSVQLHSALCLGVVETTDTLLLSLASVPGLSSFFSSTMRVPKALPEEPR
jgi:hypothetical protein